MRPAIDALSRHFEVHAFSLRGSAATLDEYVDQAVETMTNRHIDRAVVCGVSFGGLVALRFAARHPSRTQALVLASTPGPGFTLRPRHRFYARFPRMFGPLFLLESPWRLRKEIAAALPDDADRRAFRRAMLATFCSARLSLPDMAARARLMATFDAAEECPRVASPTLIVTGERTLDFVVPTDRSIAYADLIRGARVAVLERTGHIGTITRPEAFAQLTRAFVDEDAATRQPHRENPDAA